MSREHFSRAEMIKQPPYCAFQMQKGKQSLRHKEKLFPSFIIFYTLKFTIKQTYARDDLKLTSLCFVSARMSPPRWTRSNLHPSWLRYHKARIGMVGCLHNRLEQFCRHFQKTKTPTTNNFANRPNPYFTCFQYIKPYEFSFLRH